MTRLKIIYRFHAIKRMFERQFSESDILSVLGSGEVLEDYSEDLPYPSRLMLGFSKNRPVHVVVADWREADTTIVITVYEPDLEYWEPGFKVRKKL